MAGSDVAVVVRAAFAIRTRDSPFEYLRSHLLSTHGCSHLGVGFASLTHTLVSVFKQHGIFDSLIRVMRDEFLERQRA